MHITESPPEAHSVKVHIGPEGIAQFLPIILARRGIQEVVVKTLEDGKRVVASLQEGITEDRLRSELVQLEYSILDEEE